jgi:hypothetical protein
MNSPITLACFVMTRAAIFLLCLLVHQTHANLYMIMEYNTDGTLVFNNVNITMHTMSMNVTLLGCDYGYYDYYMINPPVTPSVKTQITPFDCRACICTKFEHTRVEDFVGTT